MITKIITAGFLAGLVFVVIEMTLVPIFMGKSPWLPPTMIGAIVLGDDVLPKPNDEATFDFKVIMTAVVFHQLLAILYAFPIYQLLLWFGKKNWFLVGLIFGLVIYYVNFYWMTAFYPWFAMARNWISIFSHIAFGLVVAYWLR